ncbi:hypothetical protein [Methanoregula sp.]|uniref:hypothetical protein n=1 Tax=Methanoregula sp. TaxID=2052170 RepID=UPI00356AFD77
MSHLRLFFFSIMLFLICATTLVSAECSISSVTVNPSGTVTSGTQLTVKYDINCPKVNGQMYSGDSIKMTTDLANPQWSIMTYVDDHPASTEPEISTGKNRNVGQFQLDWPAAKQGAICSITLTGSVPSDPNPSQKLLQISQNDTYGNIIPYMSSVTEMPVAPITTIATTKTVVTPNPTTEVTKILTTISTTEPTPETTTIPLTSMYTSTPTKKSTTKVIPTQWPTNTPTPESPTEVAVSIFALGIAGLVLIVKR